MLSCDGISLDKLNKLRDKVSGGYCSVCVRVCVCVTVTAGPSSVLTAQLVAAITVCPEVSHLAAQQEAVIHSQSVVTCSQTTYTCRTPPPPSSLRHCNTQQLFDGAFF